MSGKIKLSELEKFQNKFEGDDVKASGVLIISLKYDRSIELGAFGGNDEELKMLLEGALQMLNAVIEKAGESPKQKRK